MKPKQPVFVVVDTKANSYSRFAGKTMTHRYEALGHVEPQWVEMLRLDPNSWDDDSTQEVA